MDLIIQLDSSHQQRVTMTRSCADLRRRKARHLIDNSRPCAGSVAGSHRCGGGWAHGPSTPPTPRRNLQLHRQRHQQLQVAPGLQHHQTTPLHLLAALAYNTFQRHRQLQQHQRSTPPPRNLQHLLPATPAPPGFPLPRQRFYTTG